MLPRPNLSFTLPSIHDDTILSCRIYHPAFLNDPTSLPSASPWPGHAAVVAHPYAPLGGCFDDPVVDVVASTLLQLGFVIATFNFRGSAPSGGRTSWTSKPERADYISVVGFLIHYVHYLDPPQSPSARMNKAEPLMLLAGYSYGAMITTKLPPLDTILSYFISPIVPSAAADIRLRAQHLAEQQNTMFATPASPRKSLGMRVGGDQGGSPPKSRDRSSAGLADREERIRKGVKELLERTKRIRKKHDHTPAEHVEDYLEKVTGLTMFSSAYLAVSPPVGMITNLATMSFPSPFSSWSRRSDQKDAPSTKIASSEASGPQMAADETLIKNPTLVVYGSQDGFITPRKMRDWAGRLGSVEGTRFRYIEVSGAGHFWLEEGAMYRLRDAVGTFAAGLLGRGD
ncbi:Alpha/Beta hydrolase protein [Biscogniauxia marginata]|nr:Alpha/Beta hydrolase protein [Biscogniauxia marginata]